MNNFDRCSYTHDVSDSKVFSSENEWGMDFPEPEWHCPHYTHEDADQCVFHLSPNKLNLTDEEVARRFCWVINGEAHSEENISEADRERYLDTNLTTRERKQFIGAEFGDFRPPVSELVTVEEFRSAQEETPIDLRASTVDGVMDWTNMRIGHEIFLDGSCITALDFSEATVEGDIESRFATVKEDATFTEVTTKGNVTLKGTTIQRHAEFDEALIEGTVDLGGWISAVDVDEYETHVTIIRGFANFRGVTIQGDLSVSDATIKGVTRVSEATIEGDVQFTGATIEHDAYFTDTIFEDEADFTDTTFQGNATFTRATFQSDATFTETTIGRIATFADAVFENAVFAPTLTHPAWSIVDLTESSISDGNLAQPEDSRIFYDLTDATIGAVEMQANDLNPYRFVRFHRTEFDGFDFDREAEKIAAVDWKLYTLSEDGYEAFADAAEFGDAARTANAVIFELRECGPYPGPETPPSDPQSIRSLIEESDLSDLDSVPLDDDGVVKAIKTLATDFAELDPAKIYSSPPKHMTHTTISRRVTIEPLVAALVRVNRDVEAHRPSPMEKAATQRKAKIAARNTGREDIAAHFFIDEMRANREAHAKAAVDPDVDDTTYDRLKAAYDWLGNELLDLTTVYGEQTRRVIVVSLGVVGIFAVIYRLLNAPAPTGRGWGDYLLLSFQSFIAFILGGAPDTSNFYIQFASAIEGFMGAFFIALFVFALTRSVQR